MSRAKPPATPGDASASVTWSKLRTLTTARIGLARSGASLATPPLLEFRLAHARARDAVHQAADFRALTAAFAGFGMPVLTVESAAPDRPTYLMRPDLGRQLAPAARETLASHAGTADLVITVADGLSAQAIERHAAPLLGALLPALAAEHWRLAPLVLVSQGRVAIGDAVAAALGAAAVVMLIGERPGLSAPDSLGAYVTWRPTPATTDADRNCISNIRPEGVGYPDAAFKLAYLLREMRRRGLSGVGLKDESGSLGEAVLGMPIEER
ncbi:ethanolamine ammonia-lyase light chain [Aliidongia dinghuensis]|uniref:Ethanolamine ammonia-lyase small subunit n=1 Tax=Aliidongia dinghuensis TaxID=1867774 RepID=A0A8J2YTX0_9PROT|nr:ethanolamine ammonia-lyase subunit EutC [Aliidongia dinghuensis]GGF20936.1 ethanolamine ammonia-lyase light chain [Aliidongia dinghuensis]